MITNDILSFILRPYY